MISIRNRHSCVALLWLLAGPTARPQTEDLATRDKVNQLIAQVRDPALTSHAWYELQKLSEHAVPVLVSRLNEDDPQFATVVAVLSRMGPPQTALEVMARRYRGAPKVSTRLAILKGLCFSSNAQVVKLFVDATDESNEELLQYAWFGLTKFEDEYLNPHRREILERAQVGLANEALVPNILTVLSRAGPDSGSTFFFPFLNAENKAVRSAAFAALAGVQDKAVISQLRTLFEDTDYDADVRSLALASLWNTPGALQEADRIKALADSQLRPIVIGLAAQTSPELSRQLWPGFEDALLRIAQSGRGPMLDVLQALARIGTIAGFDFLKTVARDKQQPLNVRLLCINELARPTSGMQREKSLMKELATDGEESLDLRLLCLEKLARDLDGDVIDTLLNLSSSKDRRVKLVVSRVLRWAPPSDEVTRVLLKMYRESPEEPHIRESAVLGLARSGNKAAAQEVLSWIRSDASRSSIELPVIATQIRNTSVECADEALRILVAKTSDPDPRVRQQAVFTLGSMGADFILPWIDEWLGDPAEEVAKTALHWLTFQYDQRASDALAEALRDSRKAVVLAALHYAPRCKLPGLIPHILAKLEGSDVEIRRAAAIALSRLTLNVFGTPMSRAPPDSELVLDYVKWRDWWKGRNGTYDFVGRYLEVLRGADIEQRLLLLSELIGEWARDKRLEDYLVSRLTCEDVREAQLVVSSLRYAAVPSVGLLDELIPRAGQLRDTNILDLIFMLTGAGFSSVFQPSDAARADRKALLAEYQRWFDKQATEIRTWWAGNREHFRQNEESYRREFLKRIGPPASPAASRK